MITEYIISESTLNALATEILRLQGSDVASTPLEQIEFLKTITKQLGSNITTSGATVTVPAGYYSSNTEKSIASGSATTPATTITANPTISIDANGKIITNVSASKDITPTVSAGYISNGTKGTVSVSGSNSLQMTTQSATSITPTKSAQTAATANRYLTGNITVAAIPAEYIKTNTLSNSDNRLATTAEILEGYSAFANGVEVTGAMTNHGAVTSTLNAGASYTIPKGYHNGAGKVTANNLASQTSATASDTDILNGKTAYVNGSKITGKIVTMSSSNLTASDATVTVPAGYYASNATKSVANGSATTPATTITTNPTISVDSNGKITASYSGSKSITPTVSKGWVASGTAGTVSTSGSNTKQLTTQSAKTWTPTTSNQTISSGTYLTGAQTIQGDANLIASNIKSGVSIFGVAGNYSGSGSSGASDLFIFAIANKGSYGFTKRSDNYYQSSNHDHSSTSRCRIGFYSMIDQILTIHYEQSSELGYDYLHFSYLDSTNEYTNAKDNSNGTVTYDIIAGAHFIEIWFAKDSSQSENSDYGAFRIENGVSILDPTINESGGGGSDTDTVYVSSWTYGQTNGASTAQGYSDVTTWSYS